MDNFGIPFGTGDVSGTAWALFAMTGGLGYYLLHKELAEPERDRRLD
jgi:hypothetical protein